MNVGWGETYPDGWVERGKSNKQIWLKRLLRLAESGVRVISRNDDPARKRPVDRRLSQDQPLAVCVWKWKGTKCQ